MKFQKTLVAVAIAGIAAVPMVASADTTLSGVVQVQINGDDGDNLDDDGNPTDAGDPTINADDVLFGITSEHALNSGLTGYSSLRVDMNRLSNEGRTTLDNGTPENDEDDEEVTTLGSADSVYVGIKGGFGDLRFGEVANGVEVGQKANDIFDVTGDTNGGIGYTGSFGPVGLVINFAPENNEDVIGAGLTFGLGGFSIGVGGEDRGDLSSVAVGAGFSLGGFGINAHFWSLDDDADTESASVQASFGLAGASATLTFSTLTANDFDSEAVRLDAVYDLGGGMDISTRITSATSDNDANDLVSYRLKLSKAF